MRMVPGRLGARVPSGPIASESERGTKGPSTAASGLRRGGWPTGRCLATSPVSSGLPASPALRTGRTQGRVERREQAGGLLPEPEVEARRTLEIGAVRLSAST